MPEEYNFRYGGHYIRRELTPCRRECAVGQNKAKNEVRYLRQTKIVEFSVGITAKMQ